MTLMGRPTASMGSDPNVFASRLFSGLSDRYDLLAELLSFGQNARWRRTMVDRITAADPVSVLDVATGTAGVARQVVERTGATVVGVDLTEEMLRRGRDAVSAEGYGDRIRLVVGRAERLPFPDGAFEALTFTYLMRYVRDPAATLREMVRVVRPGATIASLEFHEPTRPILRWLWWLYTRVGLPAAGALAGRSWYEVGRFLGPSISQHYRRYPLAVMTDLWRAAGIADVEHRIMSLGGGVVIWGRKDDGRR